MQFLWRVQAVDYQTLHESDQTFDWERSDLSPTLGQSLEQHGMFMPLTVHRLSEETMQIIDGFKRWRWWAAQDPLPTTILCLVNEAPVSLEQLLTLRLETQPLGKSWTAYQINHVVSHWQQAGIEEDRIVEKVLPTLGIKPSRKLMRDLIRLQPLLEENTAAFQKFSFDDLLPLLRFSVSDWPAFITLAEQLNIQGNKWKSLLQLWDDVIRLKESSVSEMLASEEVAQILHSPQIQSPVRYRLLKQQLEAWRYPELTQSRQALDQCLNNLQLPSSVTVEYDPFLERDDIQLTIRADSSDSLNSLIATLSNQQSSSQWQRLFQVLQGMD